MMEDVMIDLETLGTRPGSRILSIGAVYFSREGLGKTFYRVLNQRDQIEKGLTVDQSTVDWWKDQNESARKVLEEVETGDRVHEALGDFNDFLSEATYVWGNGAGFDNVLLFELYRAFNMEPRWKFYNDRCYRTLKNLWPIVKFEKPEIKHHALHDAKAQAPHAARIFEHMNRSS